MLLHFLSYFPVGCFSLEAYCTSVGLLTVTTFVRCCVMATGGVNWMSLEKVFCFSMTLLKMCNFKRRVLTATWKKKCFFFHSHSRYGEGKKDEKYFCLEAWMTAWGGKTFLKVLACQCRGLLLWEGKEIKRVWFAWGNALEDKSVF